MRFNICIFLLFLSITVSAKRRYKFIYDIHLKNIPSTYTITYDSSSYTKIICVGQQNDTLLQSSVKISGNGLDTTLHTGYMYIQTITKIALKPGEYDVEIDDIEHTSLKAKKIKVVADRSAK